MNRILVIISDRKNIHIFIIAAIFIVLSAFFISKIEFSKAIKTNTSTVNSVVSPEYENTQLKNILSSIIPSAKTTLFENSARSVYDSGITNNSPETLLSEVLKKGKNLSYIFIYSNEEYLRPIYSSTWKQSYYQGWLFLPRKIISARHSLFTYTGDTSKIFDIEGELGFYPNISIDNKNYLNLLIYNFDLQNVIQYKNQIIVSGTPIKKGVQIVSIKNSDIAVNTDEVDQICIHLCTPTGLEIDYQNINPNYPQQDSIGDFSAFEKTYSEVAKKIGDVSDINKQNILLRNELTHYISNSSKPIFFQYNGGYQTSDVLTSNIDLDTAVKFKSDVKFSILYKNENYNRPIFHPLWKEHQDREWCYIPRKMYINMKKLFVLPSDNAVTNDLLGELGFFEEHPTIKNDQTGLLIYNFSVSKISLFENNILVEGTPSRTGLQLLGIPKSNLTNHKEYAVRLVTKDLCELDIDIISD